LFKAALDKPARNFRPSTSHTGACGYLGRPSPSALAFDAFCIEEKTFEAIKRRITAQMARMVRDISVKWRGGRISDASECDVM